jgi:tetratricopeptide (TPR) repeat protein
VLALLALAALASAAGCATARTFRCPAKGGPAWRELATENFVVRSDLPRAEAAAMLVRLERQRAAILSVLFDGATPPPGRVEVVAFRTREEYREVAPRGMDAYYLRSSGGPPRIVLSGELAPWQRALLSHELTHHFLAGVFRRQPRWLAEGLAVYMESLADEPGKGTLVVGRPPPARLTRALWNPVPVAELLAWRGPPDPGAYSLYASSWLLVHYLAHRHPGAFAGLQARLARGEDPEAAWRAELPAHDPSDPDALAALDRALHDHARGGIESSTRSAPPPRALLGFEQEMPSAEVHALRLALWPHGPDRGPAALRGEVEEALRESPHHPVGLQALAEIDRADPLPLARAAVAAHPDDPRAFTFLAGALEGKAAAAEREAAYRRAAELAPDNPAALHNLAAELLRSGRSGEALPVARRAAQLAPWSPPLLATYAAVLSDLGRCAEALPVEERALDVLPDDTAAEALAALRGELARYLSRCRSSAPQDGQGPREVGGERGGAGDAPTPGVIER